MPCRSEGRPPLQSPRPPPAGPLAAVGLVAAACADAVGWVPAAVAAGADGAVAAGAGGVLCFRNASSVSTFKSQVGLGASGDTPISRSMGANPSIEIRNVQMPSGRFGNEYAPESSVEVTKFLSPCVTVTVAPGTGIPPELTHP